MAKPALPRDVERSNAKTAGRSEPKQVWVLVFPDFMLLDATGPVQVFSRLTMNAAIRAVLNRMLLRWRRDKVET
jgi:hypothetical protein